MARMFPGEHSPEESWGFTKPQLVTPEEAERLSRTGATVGCQHCGRRYPLVEALRWPRWHVSVDRLPADFEGIVEAHFVRCHGCSAIALAQFRGEWQADGTISGDVLGALAPGEAVQLGDAIELRPPAS